MASIFYAQLILVIIYICNCNAISLRVLGVSVFVIECIHLKEIVTLTIGFLQLSNVYPTFHNGIGVIWH